MATFALIAIAICGLGTAVLIVVNQIRDIRPSETAQMLFNKRRRNRRDGIVIFLINCLVVLFFFISFFVYVGK